MRAGCLYIWLHLTNVPDLGQQLWKSREAGGEWEIDYGYSGAIISLTNYDYVAETIWGWKMDGDSEWMVRSGRNSS